MFPGQGSQEVGMGRAFYERHEEVQSLFEKAGQITKRDIKKIVFEGPKDVLDRTSNTQVAILVVSLGVLAVYMKKHKEEKPDVVMGHSLGEITAAVAADAMTEEDAIELTFTRGVAMEAAARERPGGMAAMLGTPDAEVEERARAHGISVANYNIPDGQSVVSGSLQGIEAILAEMGRRGRRLGVSIPAHAPEMSSAVQAVEAKLRSIGVIDQLRIPAIANRTGQLATRLSELHLPGQLVSPVRWGRGVEYAVEDGVAEFVEIGPGNILHDMVKRHLRGNDKVNVRSAQQEILED